MQDDFERLNQEYLRQLVGPYKGKIVNLSTDEGMHLFYNYIRHCSKNFIREFRISFQDTCHFIIHPLGKDGITLDFTLTTKDTI